MSAGTGPGGTAGPRSTPATQAGGADDNGYGVRRAAEHGGGIHYNRVAQVEVVPGPDGEPRTTIRYRTHVYDRYNWDANKATPISAMGNVPDAQMAGLHQSGQAKEFDMGGQSGGRTWNG